MSMDDQYIQMRRFAKSLDDFTQHMGASLRELEEQHALVAPLWQDEMHEDYERDWRPLHELMSRFVTVDGPRYLEFLHTKMRLLERYLRGG